MDERSVGFVGGGRVTGFLLEALREQGFPLSRVVVSDTSPAVRSALEARLPGLRVTADNREAAVRERVFLALHPPALCPLLPELAGTIRPDAVVVSLAPVLRFERLQAGLGGFGRLARLIPNAPSLVHRGYNPVAFAPGLPPAERQELLALLDLLGRHPEVDEERLEAYAVLAAMGPTCFWFQWEALRELGASFGLGRRETDEALLATVEGAARLLFEGGRSYAEVADMVPVKPLADLEPAWRGAYAEKLGGLYGKLTRR